MKWKDVHSISPSKKTVYILSIISIFKNVFVYLDNKMPAHQFDGSCLPVCGMVRMVKFFMLLGVNLIFENKYVSC